MKRPKWMVGHVLVVVAVVVFVNMGFWQLRRLGDRQEFNDRLTSRSALQAQPLDTMLDKYGLDPDRLELRRVHVSGEYRSEDEVILRARSFQGLSGHHVLTPLDLGDGRVVIVDRGWVPVDMDQPRSAPSRAPTGSVEVTGVLRKAEQRGAFGPVDPADGVLTQVARVDPVRLDQQIAGDVLSVFVQLLEQRPPQSGPLPEIVDLPVPSEGPHRGYAVQWFLFAAVVVVGYPLLIYRTSESG